MAERKKRASTWLLPGGILLLAALSLGGILFFSGHGASRAEVYVDGVLTQRIDLRTVAAPYTLDLGAGNRLEVRRGEVRMVWANCPDQICVHQSWSASPAKPIVCLPNRVTVLLTGGDGDVDGVLG